MLSQQRISIKVLDTIKAILSNIKVPHHTLVLLASGAGISAITVGIFYMADSGMFGQHAAEASTRRNGRISRS